MLTRGNASRPLVALIVLTLSALALTAASIALFIIKKYIGFGIYENPISCTSSENYFTTKYNQSNYLNVMTIGLFFAALAGLLLVIFVIYLKIKHVNSQVNQGQVFQEWSYKVQLSMYGLTAVSALALVVPTGYFLAFWREVGFNCNKGTQYQWILIAVLTGVSLLLYLISIVILFVYRQHFDPQQPLEDLKPEGLQKDQIKNPMTVQEDNKATLDAKSNLLQHSKAEQLELATSTLKENNLKEPLLQVPNSRELPKSHHSRLSEEEEEERHRLRQLRRRRMEEEDRLQELQRKKRKAQSEGDKGNGNQTVININLAGGQQGSVTTDKQGNKKQVSFKQKNNKYRGTRSPIYEEDSQSTDQRNHKRLGRKSPIDEKRFYSKRSFHEREASPYNEFEQKNAFTKHPSQTVVQDRLPQVKKLSLGQLNSVQISPFTSPHPVSSTLPEPKYQESRVLNVGNPIEKQEESFYKALAESGVPKQKKLQQSKAPKKGNRKKTNGLEAYIEALNVSMCVNRPGFQRNFQSNGSQVSYNSILSNNDNIRMPAERDYYSKKEGSLASRLNVIGTPQSLLAVTQKIEQKYRNR